MIFYDYLNTPIGKLLITASDTCITGVSFGNSNEQILKSNDITDSAKQQLAEYFSGERKKFNLPVQQAGTEFQQQVWATLKKISFGKSVSYQEIANKINNPKAVRAVGAANGRNAISIIIPCHRVIGHNNRLTGYAWGLERKAWLLNHEGVNFQ